MVDNVYTLEITKDLFLFQSIFVQNFFFSWKNKERSIKRIRADVNFADEEEEWYMKPSTFSVYNTPLKNQTVHQQEYCENKSASSSPFTQDRYHSYQQQSSSSFPSTPSAIPIDIPYNNNATATGTGAGTAAMDYFDFSNSFNVSSPSNHYCWDDSTSTNESTTTSLSQQQPYINSYSPVTQHIPASPPTLVESFMLPPDTPPSTSLVDSNPIFTDILSRIKFSYSDIGINLEAKISNASELRLLIDAFSQLCCSSSSATTNHSDLSASTSSHDSSTGNKMFDKMLLYRNKSNQTKPINFFASTCRLGQITNPHSSLDSQKSLRQIADDCVDTFFTCWVRYKPILKKDEFMAWYETQQDPTETLIVNAICSYVFRHMVFHHPRQGLEHFLKDEDKLQEQEEFFFSRARECLSQSFDTPDRYTIIALLFMSIRAEPSKRHHYVGIAASALHELDIYPRMVSENVDSYEKEMDTRLWWFVWAIDFSLWSAGAPKNTPQPRVQGQVDLPKIFEQDIDDAEIGVITFTQCLMLWKIQADIVAALYDQDSAELTMEQLVDYDRRLLDFYKALPDYLIFDSGFEYGCEDLFLACLRVNIEYNATRIILHKLFIPEMNDTRPSQTSLESLNICLSTALLQLSAIKTCTMADIGRCAFDRDELWRAAEVISVAMDIYHTCVSPEDQDKILKGIKMDDFMQGLTKSYHILQNTREFRFSCKNWFQVAEWIQVETRRHQLVGTSTVKHRPEDEVHKKNKPDYFLAHLKPNAILNHHAPLPQDVGKLSNKKKAAAECVTAQTTTSGGRTRKSISFQNQFSIHSTTTTTTNQQQSTNTRKPSFSTAPPFVQFTNYGSPEKHKSQQPHGKSPARFRYFNPRKMNKFLFIDEHPMI
ncbi:MAG: hypothetical protein EXX96DRAFT_607393 [Benjaminiella poitrasii]|nr:MAG: hypothetical protein EXX96DRAFT_607393 [Benjaminiella poitrasii]